jgi:NTP pyrophosphatase (non-canonical NTP hydrolase)
MSDSLNELQTSLQEFARARDWEQFHSPKNLACALSVEAAELLEQFQWMTEHASRELEPAHRARVADEMADVLLYLAQLASVLGVDLVAQANAKLMRNAERYPVELARGVSTKYDQL